MHILYLYKNLHKGNIEIASNSYRMKIQSEIWVKKYESVFIDEKFV